MSRELIRHELIKKYCTIWMDSVRNGTFGLTNTNRLIRSYKGATGLKTGYTDKAMFCVSATAARDGMELISVIMGADSSNLRFNSAKQLLDYGFANYALLKVEPEQESYTVPVKKGIEKGVPAVVEGLTPILAERGNVKNVQRQMELLESVEAPVEKGQKIGEFVVSAGGKELARYPVVAANAVDKLGFSEIFRRMLGNIVNK
jgi:D-alanyl-D-alanine carboxypeptidase (penicillin-binding protein 5/6)